MLTLHQQLLRSSEEDSVCPITDEYIKFHQYPEMNQYWRSILRHGGGQMQLHTDDDSPLLLHARRFGRGTVFHFSLNHAANYYHGFAPDAASAELVWQEMVSLWEEFGSAGKPPKLMAKLPWVVTFATPDYPAVGGLHHYNYYERLLLFILARDAGLGTESRAPVPLTPLPNDLLFTTQDWDSGVTEHCQETDWPVLLVNWTMLLEILRKGEVCATTPLPDTAVALLDAGAKIKVAKNDSHNHNQTVYIALDHATADRFWPEIEAAHTRWQQHNPDAPPLKRPSAPWVITHSTDFQRRPNLPSTPRVELSLACILAHLRRGEIPQETP
ncbi:MAG: hypothetical protein LBK60_03700 [Verrucomicrobiales bacterium]|jgi:hypothetical protein|nr:hypothetical protein [Verrucomicrobiales bacterium]